VGILLFVPVYPFPDIGSPLYSHEHLFFKMHMPVVQKYLLCFPFYLLLRMQIFFGAPRILFIVIFCFYFNLGGGFIDLNNQLSFK